MAMSSHKKLSIIIPAYNEEATIQEVIRKVQNVNLDHMEKEIVVVDDGSRDRTREILKQIPGIRYIFHEKNLGKGGALKTGIQNSTGDLILLQDADLEYDPEDYRALVQPILERRSEFVMGSRFITQRPHFFTKNGDPFFTHYIGNWMIIWLTNFLYGQRNTDYEGCYKVFTRSLAQSIPVITNGFAFDNELICKTLRRRYRISEVPIHYSPRLYSQGKKITWRDGIVMLWTIFKWRFLPFNEKGSSLKT